MADWQQCGKPGSGRESAPQPPLPWILLLLLPYSHLSLSILPSWQPQFPFSLSHFPNASFSLSCCWAAAQKASFAKSDRQFSFPSFTFTFPSWPTLYPDPPVQGPSSYCGGKSRFDCKLRRIDSADGSNVLAGAKIMTIYRMSGKNGLRHSQN